MGIIVQKYGGSSVSTPEKLRAVANRVVRTHQEGHQVVVVVSAMGDTTNQLLNLAREVSPEPHRRELDMLLTVGERISMSLLSMAIQDLGAPAVSFTGSQSGIITNNTHTNARITKVVPTRVRAALSEGKIVIIAGFQGVSEQLEITSLGRGGSDTTAVAMAAALDAIYAEICSDVDGVYSADPRLAPSASRVDELSYDEMQALADGGAKVLNAEAVEWAKRSGVEIRCVSTHDEKGNKTSIRGALRDPNRGYKQHQLAAITHHPGLLRVMGVGLFPPSLSALLRDSGAVDAEIYQLSERSADKPLTSHSAGWECWIPLQNIHHPERLSQELRERGVAQVEEGWSWVTLVGRSLLSQQSPSAEDDLTDEMEGRKPLESYTLIQRAEALMSESNLSFETLSFTPSSLRWAVRLSDAPLAVRRLHEELCISSTS